MTRPFRTIKANLPMARLAAIWAAQAMRARRAGEQEDSTSMQLAQPGYNLAATRIKSILVLSLLSGHAPASLPLKVVLLAVKQQVLFMLEWNTVLSATGMFLLSFNFLLHESRVLQVMLSEPRQSSILSRLHSSHCISCFPNPLEMHH